MTIAILAILSLIAALLASLLWRTRSPIQSTKPTPTSDDSVSSTTLTTISTMFEASLREMREMTITLVQGREQPLPTTPTETLPTENERALGYDYDQTPLSPGIEEVERREAEEALLEVSLRERRVWQERMAEVARLESEKKQILEDLEISSPGPWQTGSVHDQT